MAALLEVVVDALDHRWRDAEVEHEDREQRGDGVVGGQHRQPFGFCGRSVFGVQAFENLGLGVGDLFAQSCAASPSKAVISATQHSSDLSSG